MLRAGNAPSSVCCLLVMAGFIPAIHVFLMNRRKDVDGRNKSGHDDYWRVKAYFSPTLNGGSLPGGVVSSAIASSIATMT
jgi:hypothetical protein